VNAVVIAKETKSATACGCLGGFRSAVIAERFLICSARQGRLRGRVTMVLVNVIERFFICSARQERLRGRVKMVFVHAAERFLMTSTRQG
jgi:hypothetical protein